jgi:hypothetical protein
MVDNEGGLLLPGVIGHFGDIVENALSQFTGKRRPFQSRQFLPKFGTLYHSNRFGFSSHDCSFARVKRNVLFFPIAFTLSRKIVNRVYNGLRGRQVVLEMIETTEEVQVLLILGS